jgi:hypothetical protein
MEVPAQIETPWRKERKHGQDHQAPQSESTQYVPQAAAEAASTRRLPSLRQNRHRLSFRAVAI